MQRIIRYFVSCSCILIACLSSFHITAGILDEPLIVIDKDISNDNFAWSDTVRVTIKIKNEGNASAKNIHVTDYYPAGFKIIKDGNVSITNNSVQDYLEVR